MILLGFDVVKIIRLKFLLLINLDFKYLSSVCLVELIDNQRSDTWTSSSSKLTRVCVCVKFDAVRVNVVFNLNYPMLCLL